MRRVFAIEIYMTCIQTATATVAADNDIVMLSPECESRYLNAVCVYDRYYSIVRFSNCIFSQPYAMCVYAGYLLEHINWMQFDSTKHHTQHNNNRCIEVGHTHTHMSWCITNSVLHSFARSLFPVTLHICWYAGCPNLRNWSTINFSFAPFFPVQRLIYTHYLHLYAKSFEYKIGLIIKLATYSKTVMFCKSDEQHADAGHLCWLNTDERWNCWTLLCQDSIPR